VASRMQRDEGRLRRERAAPAGGRGGPGRWAALALVVAAGAALGAEAADPCALLSPDSGPGAFGPGAFGPARPTALTAAPRREPSAVAPLGGMAGLSAAAGSASAVPAGAPPPPADRPVGGVVAVLLARNLKPYREAAAGFEKALAADPLVAQGGWRFPKRVVEGTDPGEVRRWLAAQRPLRLILALGTEAARLAAEAPPAAPIVFAMVANPVDAGLLPARPRPDQRICGVTTDVDPAEQFRVVREVLPKARRLAVIYCPAYTEATVRAGVAAAEKAGLRLLALPVEPFQVAPALERLAAEPVDAVWTVTDPGVVVPAAARRILQETLRRKVPVVGFSPAMVRAGALLGFGIEPRAAGREAGGVALALLRGEKTPADFHVVYPRAATLYVNPAVADRLGVRIPRSLRLRAKLVAGR